MKSKGIAEFHRSAGKPGNRKVKTWWQQPTIQSMGVHGGLIKAFITTLPFTMLGVLGAYNQVAQDSFDTPEFGPLVEQRITAYVEPVSMTHRKLMAEKDPSEKLVREVAAVWLARFERGDLDQLPPVTADDSTRDGAKQQILNAKSCVITHLTRIGDEQVRRGNTDGARDNYTIALKLAKVMMFSDLTSLSNGLSFENGLLSRLTKMSDGAKVRVVPTTGKDVNRVIQTEFQAGLSDPKLTPKQRERMHDQFERAIRRGESIRTILDGQLNDYSLSILFGNVRRVELQVARQHRLIEQLERKTPSLLAQGNRSGKDQSI